jgi:hypothetical protein
MPAPGARQSGEVGHCDSRFRIPPIAVMIKKPGSLLGTHFTTEGVFEPVLVAERGYCNDGVALSPEENPGVVVLNPWAV